jgi:hypothetical protein
MKAGSSRRTIRIAGVLLLAHTFGSYGVCAFDALQNYDLARPPWRFVAASPVHIPSFLFRTVCDSIPRRQFLDLSLWLSAYALPFALVLLTTVMLHRDLKRPSQVSGFPVQ